MTKPKPKPGLYVPVYNPDTGKIHYVPHGYEAEMYRQMRGRGRPSKASTVFKGYAAVLAKDTAAREFLERDAALYAAGEHGLNDRADVVGMPVDTYKKHLTRFRKVCPEYRRRIRGQKTA
jgi:hypothetical protein